jgi:hypothetical protein
MTFNVRNWILCVTNHVGLFDLILVISTSVEKVAGKSRLFEKVAIFSASQKIDP